MALLREDEMISHLTFRSIFSNADLGILLRSPLPKLSAAAGLQNIGKSLYSTLIILIILKRRETLATFSNYYVLVVS